MSDTNDNAVVSPPIDAMVATEQTTTAPSAAANDTRSGSRLWFVLAFIVMMLLILAISLLWQRLDALQNDVARRLSTAEQAATVARASSESLTSQLRSAENRLAAAEARIADYAAQRASLDKLLSDATSRESLRISGDFEQLLSIAEQEAQLTLSPAPLLTALRVLDARADLAPSPARDKLKAAIAKDSDVIRSADLPDRTQLLTRSDELARLVDELPLAAEVKPQQAQTAQKPQAKKTPAKTVNPSNTGATIDSKSSNTADNKEDTLPSIVEIISAITAPLTDWFRLRRIDGQDALLTTPEQQFWLRENMKLQLQSARLSLLSRQSESYQNHLDKLQQAIKQYTDSRHPKVEQALALIAQLRSARLNAVIPMPKETRVALIQLANMSPQAFAPNSANTPPAPPSKVNKKK